MQFQMTGNSRINTKLIYWNHYFLDSGIFAASMGAGVITRGT